MKLNCAFAVHQVRIKGSGQRRRSEVIEGNGELDRRCDLVHQVLQVEEVHVAGEVAEESEEVCVPRERGAQRAGLAKVMPADALQRQIEPVLDLRMASTRLINCHLATDPIDREDHRPADRVAEALKRFAVLIRDLIDDVLQLRRL